MVKMSEIPAVLPPLVPVILQWVAQNAAEQAGPVFFRYLRFEQEDSLLVDVGVPILKPVPVNGNIIAGSFPAANYVTITHIGDYSELKDVHMRLEDWIKDNGLREGAQQVEGEDYGARIESYVTDPDEEPDPRRWITEVSVMLANK
jgi:effector-binding domain-containing protein